MNTRTLLTVAVLLAGCAVSAAYDPTAWKALERAPLKFTAQRIAASRTTQEVSATGNVVAMSAPFSLRSECLTRDASGLYHLYDPTCVTTCSNDVGHTHWSVTGEVEYRDSDRIVLRNAWLRLWEIPVFWLPYAYYPLDVHYSFRIMGGWTKRWGAYILTKTMYPIFGDSSDGEEAYWMNGSTRLDWRYENGAALGETLRWNLGSFGKGQFKVYYAWDEDYDHYDYHGGRHSYDHGNWGSNVDRDRYVIDLQHLWNPTERDTVRIKGEILSDSYFTRDFLRTQHFAFRNLWLGHEGNHIAWEHVENTFAFGAEASGPINDFYGGTCRLPELYFDVQPQPVFGLPVNYESENRLGYLMRRHAKYGDGKLDNPYAYNPGRWAEYDTVRFDTYHRFTAPFRTCDDLLSVVPRLAYRGTYWAHGGADDLTGWNKAARTDSMFRSVGEAGVTFAARGTAWIDETWRHMLEPYMDVLAQKAWLSGVGDGERPYVFDNLDASTAWEDQFAGRGRNLPYTYCGITPGLRNTWSRLDENGKLHQVLDFDAYVAAQFNEAKLLGRNDAHTLAEPGYPNYGRHGCTLMPGVRARWTPDDDISLLARAEYDADYNRLAVASIRWNQRLSEDFGYNVMYAERDHRWWDYSSSPYDPSVMTGDEFNYARFHYIELGFTHQVCDWLAWGPTIRWDIRDNELDSVGGWVDYLTDCLGFRLSVTYVNEYTRIDGYEREEDFDVGFFVYLRAFGPGGVNFLD